MNRTLLLLAAVAVVAQLLAGLAPIGLARAELGNEIDTLFADIDTDAEPGCAAGVIHRGEYLHAAGYGLANLEHRVPLTPSSVFRTGSVSKQFTAMAIALLAENGRLDLDADVHDYLPDLADYGEKVTVRQMVHHIAGMGDYDHEALRKSDGSEFRFGNEDYATIDEFYRMVAGAGLIHPPGSRYQYSNLAYFLLARVVESVTGQTLAQFAEENIFAALGMSQSLFNDNVDQVIPQRAYGYRQTDDGAWESYDTNLDWVGDGGVYTSLNDFVRWDRNFYRNALGDGEQSLIDTVETPHPDSIEMTDDGPRNANYAFGLAVGEENGHRVIGHTGSWVAFTASYRRYPDLELSVVVFCNSGERYAPALGQQVSALAVDAVTGGEITDDSAGE